MAYSLRKKVDGKISKINYKTTKRRQNKRTIKYRKSRRQNKRTIKFIKSRRQNGGEYNEDQIKKIREILIQVNFSASEIKTLIDELNSISWYFAKPKQDGRTTRYDKLLTKLSVVVKPENNSFSIPAKQKYIRDVIKKSKQIAYAHYDDGYDTDVEDE
jgi:signal recognition particle GTPase